MLRKLAIPEQDLWDIVGGTTRRKILDLLISEPHYVSQLAKILDKSQPAILKQMKILEDAGIVTQEASTGQPGPPRHYYKLNKSFVLFLTFSPYFAIRRAWDLSQNTSDMIKKDNPTLNDEINNQKTLVDKLMVINRELRNARISGDEIAKKMLALEGLRDNLMEIANKLIQEAFKDETTYIDRQVIRKVLCEDATCVEELAAILNKQEQDVKKRISDMKEKGFIREDDKGQISFSQT